MSRRYLWICEACGAQESTEEDARPSTWREAHVWARGDPLSVINGRDTKWLDGDVCQACHFDLDRVMHAWRVMRGNARNRPAPESP
jgi:hypothetical protein